MWTDPHDHGDDLFGLKWACALHKQYKRFRFYTPALSDGVSHSATSEHIRDKEAMEQEIDSIIEEARIKIKDQCLKLDSSVHSLMPQQQVKRSTHMLR
jgi:hypothetical protein